MEKNPLVVEDDIAVRGDDLLYLVLMTAQIIL